MLGFERPSRVKQPSFLFFNLDGHESKENIVTVFSGISRLIKE